MMNKILSQFLKTRLSFWQVVFWLLGVGVCLSSLILVLVSPRFSYDYTVAQMPIIFLVVGLVCAGGLFLLLRFVVPRTEFPCSHSRSLILGIFILGLLARAILLFSEPVLEDDYQRYLWDGGLAAHGISPYIYSPRTVLGNGAAPEVSRLKDMTFPLLDRVNHPDLRTVYPPGVQAFFVLSHYLSPWSLGSWRFLCLMAEVISFLLLLAIMRRMGRDEVWLVLYWWNPLVIKELINSAHMEAVLLPFILTGILALLSKRFFTAGVFITLAASIKIWPAFLLPLIWRQMLAHRLMLTFSLLFTLGIGLLSIWPFLTSGLNEASGLVAYGQKWKTNSAFFPVFEWGVGSIIQALDGAAWIIPYAARALVLGGLSLLVLQLARHGKQDRDRTLWLVFIVVLAIFLVSPAQFPWYFTWVSPLLVFFPFWGLCLLVPLMGLYYAGFYLIVTGQFELWGYWLSLAIWLPVWAVLLAEFFHSRRYPVAK